MFPTFHLPRILAVPLVLLPAILLAALVLTSCSDDDDAATTAAPALAITAADLTFPSTGGEGSAVLSAGDLTVASSSAWCTARAEGNTVYVTVAPNTSLDGRTAVLTVAAANGATLQLPVQQRGMLVGALPVSSLAVDNAGETLTYDLPHDQPMTITTTAPWIHPTLDGDRLTILVDANDGGIRRGSLTYESAGFTNTLYLAQYNLEKEILGTYILGGFTSGALTGTTVHILQHNGDICLWFANDERWKDTYIPLDFDPGRAVLTMHSRTILCNTSSGDMDVFYFYSTKTQTIATSYSATMTATLVRASDNGEEYSYAPLVDGGTWSGNACDAFLIRSTRVMGLVNTVLMNVTAPFLLRMGDVGEDISDSYNTDGSVKALLPQSTLNP